jgi:hypothetical protein
MPVGVRAAETMYTGGSDDMMGILEQYEWRRIAKEHSPLNNNRRPFSIISLSGPELALSLHMSRDAIGDKVDVSHRLR